MNKPFEVCLQSVLPSFAEAFSAGEFRIGAKDSAGTTAYAEASAVKGKGRLQTGIEVVYICP